MIKKFKQKFLYRLLTNSFYRGNFGAPRILEFYENNTDHFNPTAPVIKWDKLVNVKQDSILLLLEKVQSEREYLIIYRFLFLDEIKIVEMLAYKGQENNFYSYFEELTE